MFTFKKLKYSVKQTCASFLVLTLFVSCFTPTEVLALQPADPEFRNQDFLQLINAPDAWNISWGSADIVVAVIDSGVDIFNPDLKDNIWVNRDEVPNNGIDDDHNGYIDDVNGWDYVSKTNNVLPQFDVTEEQGLSEVNIHHGTLVAGVIGARGGNDMGVAGVAWRVSLMPLRVLNGAGIGNTFSVAQAIDYARENGARIINLSFVGSQASETLKLALERAYNAGILVVSASGNELKNGVDLDVTPEYPICSKGTFGEDYTLGVAALDSNLKKASFSNFGSSCIDLSAPGVNIYTTEYTNSSYPAYQTPWGGWWSGTSVAVPQVVGAAALALSLNPRLSLTSLRQILLQTASPIDDKNPEYVGKLGAGVLNVAQVVRKARETYEYPESQILEKTTGVLTVPASAGGPQVRAFTVSPVDFFAYNKAWKGGLSIASGKFGSSGAYRIVTVPLTGSPEVKVWDQEGNLITSFYAYAPNFSGGVNIALGDVNGDGALEIVTTPASKGGAHVRVFDWNGTVVGQFFADIKSTKGVGMSVSAADIDSDGKDEIILGAGAGLEPYVKVYNGKGEKQFQWLAFARSQTQGLSIAALSANHSQDRLPKIIASLSRGARPEVRVFDTAGRKLNAWNAFPSGFLGGVSVATVNYDGSGTFDIVVGAGPGGGPHVRVMTQAGAVRDQWFAYDTKFRGGVRVTGIK